MTVAGAADKFFAVLVADEPLDPDPLDGPLLAGLVPALVRAEVNVVEERVDGVDPEGGPVRAVLALWVAAGTGPVPRLDAAGLAAGLPWSSTVYPVDEQLQWGHDGGDEPGRRVPGVKRISFVLARPGLDRAAFATHWRDVHGPLARRHHPTLVRYRQNVVSGPPSPGARTRDGVAELHFPSAEDYDLRRYSSEEGKTLLVDDVRQFLGAGSASVWVGEHPVVSVPVDSRQIARER